MTQHVDLSEDELDTLVQALDARLTRLGQRQYFGPQDADRSAHDASRTATRRLYKRLVASLNREKQGIE